MPLVAIVVAVKTVMLFLVSFYRKVCSTESLGWSQTERWSARTFTRAVAANQTPSKFFSEGSPVGYAKVSVVLT